MLDYLMHIKINLLLSCVVAVLDSPNGPHPMAVNARTAMVYIVADINSLKATIVLSAPVTVLLVEQSESAGPS